MQTLWTHTAKQTEDGKKRERSTKSTKKANTNKNKRRKVKSHKMNKVGTQILKFIRHMCSVHAEKRDGNTKDRLLKAIELEIEIR